MTILKRSERPEEPEGCLSCNRDAIVDWFHRIGVTDEQIARIHPIPTPRHAWSDVIVCDQCGQAHLFIKETNNGNTNETE